MNTQQKTKGFTIIEVVLVLAIAGLIFLMVFTALPALQRSQRDTARKQDLSTVTTAVTNYLSNNRSTFPTTATLGSYVTNVSSNTTSITVAEIGQSPANPSDGQIIVTQKTTCGDSGTSGQALNTGTARQFTAVTLLESGNNAFYCQDN